MNKHYIRLDQENNIIKGFSDAFEEPQKNDVCICESGGRHFEMLEVINPLLKNMEGNYLFKYENNKVVNNGSN